MTQESHTPLVQAATKQLIFNLALFHNAIEQVNPHKANEEVMANASSFNFIFLHLISSRFSMAKMIGLEIPNPTKEMTAEEKFNPDYTLWLHWVDDITSKIELKLKQLSAGELMAAQKFNPPTGDNSLLGIVQFLLFHEAYHFGQLGILRKTMQLESLSFSVK